MTAAHGPRTAGAAGKPGAARHPAAPARAGQRRAASVRPRPGPRHATPKPMTNWDLRPARDHGLTPTERLRSPGRERGLGSLATAWAWRRLVRAYLRLAHGLRVDGAAHLPDAPFVMVANHASHLDALTLAAALPGRLAGNAFALAAGDTFFSSAPVAAFAAYAVNALPVWRKRTTAGDLDALRSRLHADRAVLILFPEGTRSRTGAMAAFRPGVGALVAGSEVPVVPCFLAGAHAAWPPGQRLPHPGPSRRKLHLAIGAPLRFADTARDRDGQISVATACEAAVRALDPSGRGGTGRQPGG